MKIADKLKPRNMNSGIKDLLKKEKTKKMLVFAALGLLFVASLYFIFAPSGKDGEEMTGTSGINTSVPQATENGMSDDKLKVYEFSVEEKDEERDKAIDTLSELYEEEVRDTGSETEAYETETPSHIDRSVRQYKETANALSTFYDTEYDAEKEEMKEEIIRLNEKLQEMENSQTDEDQQLALLEKSYQMASKYLPIGTGGGMRTPDKDTVRTVETRENVLEVIPDRKPVVSYLSQPMSDEELIAEYSKERNLGFLTPTAGSDDGQKNTIACKVDRTTTIKENETLQLRLLESVIIGGRLIPKNTLLTARSRLAGNRMTLHVTTVEVNESILPVNLTAYDMDGLEGVFIPGSEEMDAFKEIGADIGSSIGTSFTFSSSAKDQIISDAARGLMQGTSDYIVKKLRTVKVTIKSGHRLMLMSAK